MMSRDLFRQIGGFDLGLRRWGCEFIDLAMKVYEHGGACFVEPATTVGHLFRPVFPYRMSYRDFTYNKLRTAYLHLPANSFERFTMNLQGEPGFAEAREDFARDLPALEGLRKARLAANCRPPEWYVQTFLPELFDGARDAREQEEMNVTMKERATMRDCPSCGATNVGEHTKCLLCEAPLAQAKRAKASPSKGRHCPNPACGKPVAARMKFCTACGTQVN